LLHLAIRQLLSKKRQTTLIFLGISFGTMVYIIVAGLQLGMRQYLIEQLLNNSAHIQISGKENYIEKEEIESVFYPDQKVFWISRPSGKREVSQLNNPYGWFNFLDKQKHVLAYSPKYVIQSIATNSVYKATLNLNGIIPEKVTRVTGLEDYMRENSILDLSGGSHKIILASKVMKKLGVHVGQTIQVSDGQHEPVPFKISGEIRLGNEAIDESFALAHIKDVQSLDNSPGRITDISVTLDDMDYAIPLAKSWNLVNSDDVKSWQEVNEQFMEVIMVQDLFRYIITLTVLLVAGFGIYNVLSIMISQKQKEIAILKSIGYSKESILELFLLQGILLGAIGGLIGLALGFGLCQFIGSIELSFEFGKSNHLWISYDPYIYIAGFLAAFGSSLVAGILPSYHASRLTPLEIIRNNT
jgi:lipoprotein-releasing system permease protein